MKTQMTIIQSTLSKNERNFNSRSRTFHLQCLFSEILTLTFHYTIQYLDSTAQLHPELLKQEFTNSFEMYVRTEQAIRHLEESGRSIISGLLPNVYGRTEEDLFRALKPETQELLRQQGTNYE